MIVLRDFIPKIFIVLCAAMLPLAPGKVWADGGAGIRFQIPYSDEDDEEDDDDVGVITARPFGFTPRLTLKYDLLPRLQGRIDYGAAPTAPNLWAGFTLDGPRLRSDDTQIRYISPRFNTHFPGLSYTPNTSGSSSVPDPSASDDRPQTWANDTATEQIDNDSFGRNLWTGYASRSREEIAVSVFGISPESAHRLVQRLDGFAQKERVRDYLGDDAFRKLQAEFGPQGNGSSSGPSEGAATQPDSARDFSGWNDAYLYCGGTCAYRY